ncbi:MAG: DUF4412 domain-containing protein [Terriglobales bacterium]
MNQRVAKFALVISVVLLTLCVGMSAQAGPSPFSADMSTKNKGGQNMTGKFYFAGQKLRIDMNTEQGEMGMIHDIPGQVSYLLMKPQHMYMEMHAEHNPMMRHTPDLRNLRSFDPDHPCASLENTACEKLGSETVMGRSTDKWMFKSKDSRQAATVWIDRKLQFPIKVVDNDGSETDFTNIQEGRPSASLFEIPAGYQKFDARAMTGGRMPQ